MSKFWIGQFTHFFPHPPHGFLPSIGFSWFPDTAENLNFPQKYCLETRRLAILQEFFIDFYCFYRFFLNFTDFYCCMHFCCYIFCRNLGSFSADYLKLKIWNPQTLSLFECMDVLPLDVAPLHYAVSHVNRHYMLISNRKVSIPFLADAKLPMFWPGSKIWFLLGMAMRLFLAMRIDARICACDAPH